MNTNENAARLDEARTAGEQMLDEVKAEQQGIGRTTTDPRLVHDPDCTATHFEGGVPKIGCPACDYAAERHRPRFKLQQVGPHPIRDIRLTLNDAPLHGVGRVIIDANAADKFATVTLEVLPESIDFDATCRLLIDTGAMMIRESRTIAGDAREHGAKADRLAEALSLGGAGAIDARQMARRYLTLPTHMRYSILAELGIISKDAMTEAMIDGHAGRTLDANAFALAVDKSLVVPLRDAIERAHTELDRRRTRAELDDDDAHDAGLEPDTDVGVHVDRVAIDAHDIRALNRAVFALHTVAPVRAVLSTDELRDVIVRLSRIAGNPMSDDVVAAALALPRADA